MDEADIPIDIHILKLQDWLVSRRIVPKNIQTPIKDIRAKITNALQDMPSNEQLINLLAGTNINYYHVREIIEILKQTEKDTKSVFGTYGSKRMKDWQEIINFYEKDNIYLAEAAKIFTRNINFEIPGIRKQMTKLEQQYEDTFKRIQDLHKPEAQLLAEHAALLQQLNLKGDNLREEFLQVLAGLPKLYAKSIKNIGNIRSAIDLYAECSGQPQCLPITQHLIEFGNTTIYQYIHKEVPITVEEPPIHLNLSLENEPVLATGKDSDNGNNEIDFGTDNDNGGTSSTVSAEIIDFADFNLGNGTCGGVELTEPDTDEIDWGIESAPTDTVEINFDIPIEEYGVVVEGVGMDGGTAKGDQAYTLLDSPNYRDRFLDEIYELEAFLRLRLYELNQLNASSNIMLLIDNVETHDVESIRKLLTNMEKIIHDISSEQIRHIFQLKHSPKYADLLASKLKQMKKAVEKIRVTQESLKVRANQLRQERQELNPVLDKLIAQTKALQMHIVTDISKRYKNRVVNIIGCGFN